MSRRNRIQLHATGMPQIDVASYPEFTTMADFVRRVLPEIDKLAARGYELSEICAIFAEKSGVKLSVPTFKSTVSRLRRETKYQAPQRGIERATRPVPVATGAVATAPVATGVGEAYRSHVRTEGTQSLTQQSRGFVDRDDL
ncbi:hypothetical protein E2P84_36655 [Burkholderia cepacia]|uniref:Uncharacterized protein n=1 Tax=Burkholderia cepacia TaxID=292 RepID=A0AAX2RR52_BURCE|nr:hypothetical protein [Burkholderia cepacia]TES65662.1 hypothetical protein E2P84_36655 [Burkholderia cepacia]TET01682.1 hypothetical protein E3D36_16740 [Burkholderia cepacia]TEU47540.1 hypothetical protein E3D37_16170 [Burkholderia cepacia]TEU53567.1 hypothetical protein E3D38_12560 [Burkholderia cepacia]TEV02173.1 hypothetical protein E3D40_13490 [Burkholderia cepacia]